MKRFVCLILLLALAASLGACARPQEPLQEPVRFYFPRVTADYNRSDGVIAWEYRESTGHSKDYVYLVSLYLEGPETEGLRRLFPRSVKLLDLQLRGGNAKVILNDYASQLTGLELNLACACLTVTVTELTGVLSVTVQAQSGLLDGNSAITMTREQILQWDDSIPKDS